MRVQTDDPSFLAELLRFFRASGCIAYFNPELEALEVIAPHLFGPDEERQLQELLASWRLAHPEVDLRVSADVPA
jgi:hypothetical protein